MFSPGFVFQNGNNYGVVKTETVFGFGPDKNFGQTLEPQDMFEENFGRSFKDTDKSSQMKLKKSRNRNRNNKIMERKRKKQKHKVKKCFYKLLKGKKYKFLKKLLLPLLIGILVAKSLFLPLALKALAFVLFKGILIGYFSATILSLRGILSYNEHHRRNGEIENMYIPSRFDLS